VRRLDAALQSGDSYRPTSQPRQFLEARVPYGPRKEGGVKPPHSKAPSAQRSSEQESGVTANNSRRQARQPGARSSGFLSLDKNRIYRLHLCRGSLEGEMPVKTKDEVKKSEGRGVKRAGAGRPASDLRPFSWVAQTLHFMSGPPAHNCRPEGRRYRIERTNRECL